MNINKTADECIVESASVLLKCFVDPSLSLEEKQKLTKWLICFFDYQDAINTSNQKQINFLSKKMSLTPVPLYYQNALQEFKTANFFCKKKISFENLQQLLFNHSTKQTIKTVKTFSKKFIQTINAYNIKLESDFVDIFQVLIYTIHYHISYLFKNKLDQTVAKFIEIIKTKVLNKKTKKDTLLINLILKENESFFNKLQQIQLLNFIYKIDDIFQESTNTDDIDEKINDLIFIQPKKMNISMHQILKEHQIDFYNEIWKENYINEKNSKLIMHLFAYETYFIQGYGNQEIYEDLVLKNIINDAKYWIILHKYKLINKLTKRN